MAPRSAVLNKSMREATRARILKSALELFGKHGFEGTSVRMLATHAGMAQGLLYSAFASKEAVLVALFEESTRDVQRSFALADEGATPEARLERLIRSSFDIIRAHQRFWRLSYGLRMQPGVVKGLGRHLARWTAGIVGTLQSYLEAAGVPDAAIQARLLFAMVDGTAQHFVLDPRRYPLEAVVDAMVTQVHATIPASRRKS